MVGGGVMICHGYNYDAPMGVSTLPSIGTLPC